MMRGVEVGDVVAGRFEIESFAGQGGMGSVYRARDLATGETVAIKLQADQDDAHSRRWAREAMLLSRLAGPGIVGYVAHGCEPTGRLYLVMEWLAGEDLAARLAREGLSVAESLALVSDVARALRQAHDQGVAHRDIKPSNIFLVAGDTRDIRLIDFGIARVGGATRSETLIGTPGYVAPEQARGDANVDARADVFALGCVLFECLTGRAAFFADNVMALLARILLDEAPRALEVRPDLPPELDVLLGRMLAKDPASRLPDAAAVVAAIDAIGTLNDLPARAVRRGPTVLTDSEQRLAFIVLAGARETLPPAECGAPPRTLDEAIDVAPAIRKLARTYRANAAALADGSTLLVVEATGTATDQAVHAARCALALHAMAPELPLALAVGRAAIGDRLPLGDVIDRAATLLRGATWPGDVLLDDSLAGLLDARFELRTVAGNLTLCAEKERPELPRKLLGKPSVCVGRERELHELGLLVEQCITESTARAVLVTAPAGVGKSRLLHELLARVRASSRPPEIWIGRGDPMRAGSPFGLLGQVVRGAHDVHEGDPIEVRRARIRSRVARHVAESDRARVSEFLGELVGSPFSDEDSVQLRAARSDATLMRDQLDRAWTHWLVAETMASPVLLVLEDVHWGDLPSLRLVDVALRTARNRPWMVLALARPDVHHTFPRLWVDRRVREIHLEELTQRASEQLIRAALGTATTDDVVQRLAEQAAGVPFYLEELIRDEASGRGSQLPATVLAMLQARLERLPPPMRRVLRAASIFGTTFHCDGVAHLCGAGERVRDALTTLEDHELVEHRDRTRFPGDAEFVFRHALVREAAYTTLTDEDKILGHRLAGQWLEAKGEPDAMTLAEHFERGHDNAAAVRWFRRAAEQALDGFDLARAISRADRGVACGAGGEALGALRLLKSEAYLWQGELASAERDALQAMEDLPRGGARWYKAALGLLMQSASHGGEGHVERFIRELAVSETAERSGSQTMAFALALRLLAMVGNVDPAKLFFDRLAAIDRDAPGEPAITAMVPAGQFYWWSYVEWDPWARMLACRRCARECGLVGDVMNEAMARIHIGWASLGLGASERAEAVLRDTLAFATAHGIEGLVPDFAKVHLASALARMGRTDEASEAVADAIPKLFGAGNWLIGGYARAELASILLQRGDLHAAVDEATTAASALTRAPPVRVRALAVQSAALLASGDVTRALEVARMGATLLQRPPCVVEGEPRLLLALANALAAIGDASGSERALERAADRLNECAARIPDADWRHGFANHIPEHAEILQRSRPASS